jgi:hypothetical protein
MVRMVARAGEQEPEAARGSIVRHRKQSDVAIIDGLPKCVPPSTSWSDR